jgi:hypothetical protein
MKFDTAVPRLSCSSRFQAKNSKPGANNLETDAALKHFFAMPKPLPRPVTADRSQLAGLGERRWWRAEPTATSAMAVACQRDGTTSLPRAGDHLEVLASIVGLALGVNTGVLAGAGSLSVGGVFDDEGVRAGDEPVDGGLGEQGFAHRRQPLNCRIAV